MNKEGKVLKLTYDLNLDENISYITDFKDFIEKYAHIIYLYDNKEYTLNIKDITPVINALKQNNKNITIIGNISPEGSEKVNKALALARAKSVRNALIKAGISADRITITNEYADQRRATIVVH